MSTPESPRDLTVGELLRRLADQTTRLVRAEIALARTELTDKLRVYARAGGALGGAAVLGLGAFGALTTTLIAALALAMPVWAAALIVTIVYGAIAAVLAKRGQAVLRDVNPVPTETIESTKEDVAWTKTRARSARR
jgi:hypothetical protein